MSIKKHNPKDVKEAGVGKKDAKAEKEAKEPRIKIVDVAKAAIRDGLTNAQAVAAVKDAIPTAKTTPACIAWYRNDMRKKGEKVPEPKDVARKRAEKAQAEAEKKKAKAQEIAAAAAAKGKTKADAEATKKAALLNK